jgi:hypothetical protein
MNIGPGNIEALLLEALEGRLSAADAELVWAALEAHPEWGVSWDFEDSELPRLQAEDVPAIDWTGLKKEVVTDQQIRQALRQDRERHTLDVHAKQSLYRAVGERSRTGEERRLWGRSRKRGVTGVVGLADQRPQRCACDCRKRNSFDRHELNHCTYSYRTYSADGR